MGTIRTTVVYEGGVLRPTEKLDLAEHRKYRALILPEEVQEQQTLADVLGFEPDNEQLMREAVEKQQEALLAFVGSATTEQPDDASIRHDEYLYGIDK